MSDKFKNIKAVATVKGLARTMPTIQVDATGTKNLADQLDQRAKIGRDNSRVRPMQVSQQQWVQYPDPTDQKLQKRIQALRKIIRAKSEAARPSGGDLGLDTNQFSLQR